MSEKIYPLFYYTRLLSLEKGRKIWYYNQTHDRYEEWWYFDAVQNKFAFYNKRGNQITFTAKMLNMCAKTLPECKILVYKKKVEYINNRIKRHDQQIKSAKDIIQTHKDRKKKYFKDLKKERKKFADIIKKYPEEFI